MRRGSGKIAKGFTLIEMLISLGIFGVVTGLVMANFRVGQQGDELRVAARLLESRFRRAQTSAMSGQTIFVCKGGVDDMKTCMSGDSADCSGGTCERTVPRGYGVHFAPGDDARNLIYFADTDGDKAYDAGEDISPYSVSSGAFVVLSGVAPLAGGGLDVVFVPPKPSVYINGGTDSVIATVTLRHDSTGAERSVTVNRASGQITSD